jgi:Tfp pilus assembly protein PilF
MSALQIAPDEATTHFLLAKAKLGSGDYRSATLEVERAISLNPAPREFLALREVIRKAVGAPLNEQ